MATFRTTMRTGPEIPVVYPWNSEALQPVAESSEFKPFSLSEESTPPMGLSPMGKALRMFIREIIHDTYNRLTRRLRRKNVLNRNYELAA